MSKRYKLSDPYWDQEKKDLKHIEKAVTALKRLDEVMVDAFRYVEQQNIYGELSVPYIESAMTELNIIEEDVQDLSRYANWIQEDMAWREWEFAKEFSKAIEDVSKLNLEDYTTKNTLNIQERVTPTVSSHEEAMRASGKSGEMQDKLSINITDIQMNTDIYQMQNQYEDFQASYDGTIKDATALRKAFYDQYFTTSFDHKVLVDPALEAINTCIDYVPVVGGVKQIVEGVVGTSLTGEKFTDKERLQVVAMGATFAAIDWFTLGGTSMFKNGGKALLVTAAKQTAAGLAIKAGSDKLVELGVPAEIVFVGVVLGGIGLGKLKKLKATNTEALEAGYKGTGGVNNPSKIASGWQGDDIYTGIDKWEDVTLKQGDTYYRGEPSGTDFFTNKQSIDASGSEASKLFEGLQVQEHPTFGYRGEMQGYTLKADLSAAEAKCLANSQFGKGGLDQLFIPDANELIDKGILMPVEKIKLK